MSEVEVAEPVALGTVALVFGSIYVLWGLLFLLLAWRTHRGGRSARGGAIVLGWTALLCWLPATVLIPHYTVTESPEASPELSASVDAIPVTLYLYAGIGAMAAVLVAMVALTLPAADRYFRRPAYYYPYYPYPAYYYPYPPRYR